MTWDIDPECTGFGLTCYDKETCVGLMFCQEPMTSDKVSAVDMQVECDWIFDCKGLFCRRVSAGDYIVCDSGLLGEAVSQVKNNAFLLTDGGWVYLETKVVYNLEIDGLRRNAFIGTEFSLADLLENTCLKKCLKSSDGLIDGGKFLTCSIAYARCSASMYLLDTIHRNYVQEHDYVKGDIIVVKAGAGSGKTTTQLTLAKRHSDKRILYLAFNKSLVEEIGGKLLAKGVTNMSTMTFDALLRKAYIKVKGEQPEIFDLKPQTIGGLVGWLQGKSFKLKSYYCKNFSRFCSDVRFSDMQMFCKSVLGKEVKILEELWDKVLSGKLVTFDSIRKMCLLGHWFKQSIDKDYDMIFVDEIQDFDMAMLRMLLDDTTLPKLFVGDPRQSIYEWRGCINAFDYMPADALRLEFYSTFRVGEPALSQICAQFKDCYMISKANHATNFGSIKDGNKYTYLFRSWKQLLTTARETKGMWIFGFEQKIIQMRNLHEKLQFMKGDEDLEFEDDLPAFLRSMTSEELNELICDIARNTVSKEESLIRFYTIHSYKGMEDYNVRVADDVNISDEPNLYYVALTRGLTTISMDTGSAGVISKQLDIMDMLLQSPVLSKPSSTSKMAAKITDSKEKISKVKIWSLDEDNELLTRLGQGCNYELISETLGRSVLAIEFRLRKLGSEMVLKGGSIEEALAKTKLDRVLLEEAIDEAKIAAVASKSKTRWEEKEINKMLGLVKSGTPINKIAIICGRSVGAIKEKLYEQAGKFGSIGFSIDDIMKTTGLSAIEVNSAIVAFRRKADL